MEADAVEVCVMSKDDHGKSQCLVMSGSPSSDVNNKKIVTKTSITGEEFDDASTARTELSTEIDDMSSVREKFSYGSYLADGGTFNSPECSFDAIGTMRSRSKQSDLLSINESYELTREHKNSASLLDLDSDDDYSDSGMKTSLRNKLFCENRVDFRPLGDGESYSSTFASFVGDRSWSDSRAEFYDGPSFASPSSIDGNALLRSESRAQFYDGYGHSNLASPGSIGKERSYSEKHAQLYGGQGRLLIAPSTGSMFGDGTVDTESRFGFYRVACSDSEEPLSCREKLVQPALSCDEDFWEEQVNDTTQTQGVEKKKYRNNSRETSVSIFSSVTRCFFPCQK